MGNRAIVDRLLGTVFKSTEKSIKAMNKLKLQLPTEASENKS